LPIASESVGKAAGSSLPSEADEELEPFFTAGGATAVSVFLTGGAIATSEEEDDELEPFLSGFCVVGLDPEIVGIVGIVGTPVSVSGVAVGARGAAGAATASTASVEEEEEEEVEGARESSRWMK